MINMAEIAKDADINQKQVKDWLGILEALGIIFCLNPYSNNLLKRLIKTPKLYFYDSGKELTRVFSLLDRASVPKGKGAIICMKPELSAIDKDNYFIPVWLI